MNHVQLGSIREQYEYQLGEDHERDESRKASGGRAKAVDDDDDDEDHTEEENEETPQKR